MKRIVIILFFFPIVKRGASQNIGIGTASPIAKLQINHRNTASSSALGTVPGVGLRYSNGGDGMLIISW